MSEPVGKPASAPQSPVGSGHAELAGESPQAIEQRVEHLLALNRAAIAITSELELDSLLQRIVDVARDLAGCKYSALGVLGADGYIERFPTSGISQIDREKIGAPPRGHGLLGVMLKAGRSLRIPDMSKDPRRVGFPAHHPPMVSLLGVPIFVQGKLVGDLYLTDKIGGPEFEEEDEWLVQLLATHAATALTNARLHAENVQALARISRERSRSQALFKVTKAINRSVRLDDVIQMIVRSAVDLLEAAGAAVYLLEPVGPLGPRGTGQPDGTESPGHPGLPGESRRFVARHALGLEELFTTSPDRLPMDRSLAGRAVKSGTTQVVHDTSDEPDMVFPPLAGKALRSLVAVPLIGGEEILGVLATYSEQPNAFDEEAVELLEAFGAAASAAISNASLYEEARRGRESAEREQQRLRELEQMKDEFLSTAAHELRTPLTTIRMAVGLVQEQMSLLAAADPSKVEGTEGVGAPRLDPRLLELVALVAEGSARMQSLVNDLLDLTRLEQGRSPLTVVELDLREVVRDALASTSSLFESKDQQLVTRLPDFPCGVRGDRQRLEQVVINLLTNAHKYSPADTQVEVSTLRVGAEYLVTVHDKGPGVPADEQEQIFERFYRSSVHRNDRTASTGLGLPIARKVAELHRGRVWVEPAPGGGSIFTLALPAGGTATPPRDP